MINMKTKKMTAMIMAGIFSALVLTSCTAAQEEKTQTTTAVEQTEAATQAQTYRDAYAEKLADLRASFGTPQGEYNGQAGVFFADLIDWDADGTPELAALVHETQNAPDTFRLQVFGEQNGEAVSLLNEKVGSAYGDLGSRLYVGLGRGSEGELMFILSDSHDYADLKESYYKLADGKVQSTVLSAQSSIGGWEEADGEDRPVEPDAYQIDGRTCGKEEFKARQNALNTDDSTVGVYCQHIYDLQALDAFLSAQSDTYAGGALLEADELGMQPTSWISDAMFTVGE